MVTASSHDDIDIHSWLGSHTVLCGHVCSLGYNVALFTGDSGGPEPDITDENMESSCKLHGHNLKMLLTDILLGSCFFPGDSDIGLSGFKLIPLLPFINGVPEAFTSSALPLVKREENQAIGSH